MLTAGVDLAAASKGTALAVLDREITGRWPLSVATDRLGLTAMHCAVLLDTSGDELGIPVDRSGGGTAIEVYEPARHHDQARREGWIALPVGRLGDLAPR